MVPHIITKLRYLKHDQVNNFASHKVFHNYFLLMKTVITFVSNWYFPFITVQQGIIKLACWTTTKLVSSKLHSKCIKLATASHISWKQRNINEHSLTDYYSWQHKQHNQNVLILLTNTGSSAQLHPLAGWVREDYLHNHCTCP